MARTCWSYATGKWSGSSSTSTVSARSRSSTWRSRRLPASARDPHDAEVEPLRQRAVAGSVGGRDRGAVAAGRERLGADAAREAEAVAAGRCVPDQSADGPAAAHAADGNEHRRGLGPRVGEAGAACDTRRARGARPANSEQLLAGTEACYERRGG